MRLLIMSCSATKRPDAGLLPAESRYDGPAYRVLRAWQRGNTARAAHLDILILSAEFGLITATTAIPDYDHRMTASRACERRPKVQAHLVKHLATRTYSQTLINLGADYLPALPLDQAIVRTLGTISYTTGGIGVRLGQLKHWLLVT